MYCTCMYISKCARFCSGQLQYFTFLWNTFSCSIWFIRKFRIITKEQLLEKSHTHPASFFLFLKQIIELLVILLQDQDSADIFIDVQIRSTADHLDNDMIFLIKSKLHVLYKSQIHWNCNCNVNVLINRKLGQIYSLRFLSNAILELIIFPNSFVKVTSIHIYLYI